MPKLTDWIRLSPVAETILSNHALYLLITMPENFCVRDNICLLSSEEEYFDIVCLFPLIFILMVKIWSLKCTTKNNQKS